MLRDIVKIDHDLCNGCGLCIPNCHEGALQIIDGKAYLISELMCDGLGACLGHCPLGAITIEKREAELYDEKKVMAIMTEKGKNVVVAHLKHLLEHNETEFYNQALEYLKENENNLNFKINDIMNEINDNNKTEKHEHGCGCMGSAPVSFKNTKPVFEGINTEIPSALSHWPVQLHLINPRASYFAGTDLLIAADCTAFAAGNFHTKYLAGKSLVVGCPKLDSGLETYVAKIVSLIDDAKVNTITVIIMEVPCCGGMLQIVQHAVSMSNRKVPVKKIVLSIKGDVLEEEWV